MTAHIDTSAWTRDDFKAFLLLYIAFADLELTENELDKVSAGLSEESFRLIRKQFDSCSDYDCIQIIHDQRERYFPGEEGKQVLIDEMQDVARADGQASSFEEGMVNVLRRIL